MRFPLWVGLALFALSLGCDGGGSADGGTAGRDAGSGETDAGRVDAGDDGCPCFGAAEIASIEADAVAGGTRGCMTGVSGGGATSGALSSTTGPRVLQVTVQELVAGARTDWVCASGCSDLNDDLVDDCAGAALPLNVTEIVTEAQHDACEALIAAACE